LIFEFISYFDIRISNFAMAPEYFMPLGEVNTIRSAGGFSERAL
jgi:hypothetical protein